MKSRIVRLFSFLASIVFVWSATVGYAKEYQMWVCIGQSLMDGPLVAPTELTDSSFDSEILEYKHGRPLRDYNTVSDVIASYGRISPAQIFARRLYELGERDIVIVRVSRGGHSITAFLDESRRIVPKKASNHDLWPLWVDFAKEKIAFLESEGHAVKLRGVVMYQGSSDGAPVFTPHYEEHLRRLKIDARERFGMGDLKWYQIRSPNWGSTATNIIQAAQVTNSEEDPHGEWISSDFPLGVPNVFLDGTHPDLLSTERMGVSWADGLFERFPTFRSYMSLSGALAHAGDLSYDPDGDGLGAFQEYAFGGSLDESDSAVLPVLERGADGELRYKVSVRKGDPELSFRVEYVEQLGDSWLEARIASLSEQSEEPVDSAFSDERYEPDWEFDKDTVFFRTVLSQDL